MVPPPATGPIVDLLGFLTGALLYVMLVVMVWRERLAEGAPLFSRRGRLPLLTGLFGVVWNVGAILSFGPRVVGAGEPAPILVALAFSALGFLPAVVVHALIEGREAAAGSATRPVIALAYAFSAAASIGHFVAAVRGAEVPYRPALWLLTAGFTALTASLLVVTRRQPIGRRGVWVAALAIFAVSALHFSSHVSNESWWVELIGHHASLALALAILHQDYRFALADLFLKNAIALILLMGVSLALLSGAVAPLWNWYNTSGGRDARALALLVCVWMAAALVFPLLRRAANRLVDRVVLRRPDYTAMLGRLGGDLEVLDDEEAVTAGIARVAMHGLGVHEHIVVSDTLPERDSRVVVAGPDARLFGDAGATVVRLRTVEAPHRALALGVPGGGRRLLSDDVRFLETVARLGARRIDAIRVAQERLERNVREQRIERLATEAELRALRAQLNPHFLFNALTTIGYLIQAAPSRALDTLLRLTSVLRGVLTRTTTDFSTLGDEIDFVHAYLEIEQARFEERLEVVLHVDPSARRAVIPTLLLQPLVENAVRHGLAPRLVGGRVTIAASSDAGDLRIQVADNGVGFDPVRSDRWGVGLTNVAQRLQAHYGDRARFQIQSEIGAGTVVDLSLPYRVSAEWPSSDRRKVG